MRFRKCGCPIWVFGSLRGDWIRKSLGLTNWEAAERQVAQWQLTEPEENVSVETAFERFIKDCEARHLRRETVGKYKLLEREVKKFCEDRGLRWIRKIDVDALRAYRETWELSPISSRKKLERVRTFFKFCLESDWIDRNPATALKAPQGSATPTLPFSKQEMEKILWGCDLYPERHPRSPRDYVKKLKALVLLLRHSGLRIRDAVTLQKDRVRGEKLFLYTQKTNTPVFVPLPHSVVEALEACGSEIEDRFFWSGNGEPKSAVADWQRTLKELFSIAGVRGHAHRFRDTFSVSLLEAGVPLEQVSILLGHTSLRTTERHYSPWVKSRQEKLEEAVRKTWS